MVATATSTIEADGWSSALFEALESQVELPSLGVKLTLAELYEDVPLPSGLA